MSPSSVLSSNGNHQWRKLTSITHHGHDCTSRLERRDNTHLVPRHHASKNSDPPTCWHNIWSLSSLLSLTSIDPHSWGKGILKFNSSLIDSQDWVSKGRRWWPRGIFFPAPLAAHCSASIRRHMIIINNPVLDGWVLIDSCLTWPINADSLCPHRTVMMGKPWRGSA